MIGRGPLRAGPMGGVNRVGHLESGITPVFVRRPKATDILIENSEFPDLDELGGL